jgi:uncharacterized protein YbjT (DUF2867 family)
MKIVITGSLGNVSKNITEQLAANKHQVVVISRDAQKTKVIEELGAIAAIGSVEDVKFLQQTFEGADAAYVMVPPVFNTTDYSVSVQTIANNYARALEQARVPYIVSLSSMGADVPDGNGPSSAFYYAEQALNRLQQAHVLHLRAGMFYTNFYGNIAMIKTMHLLGNNFGPDIPLPMSHPHDIADIAAHALQALSFSGKTNQYVLSDEKNGKEIAQLLGDAIGHPQLPWITFSNEQLLQGAMQNGFSEHMALKFVELGVSIQSGRLFEHYRLNKPVTFGKRNLESFAKEFAAVYKSGD